MKNNMKMVYVCAKFGDMLENSVCVVVTVRRHLLEVDRLCINAPQCFAKWYTLRRVQVCCKGNASNFLYGHTKLPHHVLCSRRQGWNPTNSPARFLGTLHGRSRVSREQYVETGLAERCIRIQGNEQLGWKKIRVKGGVLKDAVNEAQC
jgi:hypothetical protein